MRCGCRFSRSMNRHKVGYRTGTHPHETTAIANSPPGVEYIEMVKQKAASKSRGGSSSRSDTIPVTTMLLDFATRLDAHLARFAVPPSEQLKPNTAVSTNSCKAAWGESFCVQLVDASNTHKLKRAEVEDPSVVMQTANMD